MFRSQFGMPCVLSYAERDTHRSEGRPHPSRFAPARKISTIMVNKYPKTGLFGYHSYSAAKSEVIRTGAAGFG
jgi:hypothetical protein